MNFKNHQAYNFFQSATEGLKGLLSLRPLLDKIEQGIFWTYTDTLAPYIEFDYTYPNGKNGDIIKYIFEEYGETSQSEGILWHGKIGKEYIELFGIFYSAIPLSISNDTAFQKLFDCHIPTIIANRLSELSLQKAGYFKSFREYQNITLAHSKQQTKKRTEAYAQLILQGQSNVVSNRDIRPLPSLNGWIHRKSLMKIGISTSGSMVQSSMVRLKLSQIASTACGVS